MVTEPSLRSSTFISVLNPPVHMDLLRFRESNNITKFKVYPAPVTRLNL